MGATIFTTKFKLGSIARFKDENAPKKKSRSRAGWLELGGKRHYYRSSWERNIARQYQWLKEQGQIEDWEYEPKTFWFLQIKRGVRSYLPDFKITENDGRETWVEVKGYMDAKSNTKLKRMAKYYPDISISVIDSKSYAAIAKSLRGLIQDWE